MNNEARYFEVLSAAVAQIETDSFEARGVVYDRLWQIILNQLHENEDSDEVIARERAAFLSAVRRIEFGERGARPAHEAQHEAQDGVRVVGRPVRRGITGRLLVRMVSACAVLAVLCLGYLAIAARTDSGSSESWIGEGGPDSWRARVTSAVQSIGNLTERRPAVATGPSERAVLYEESAHSATGSTFGGQSVWRRDVDLAAAPSGVLLSVDAQIPQKNLILKMSFRRAPEGGAISHFVEFRFLSADMSSSLPVQDVLGILMKTDELSRGIELVGKVVRIQPGVFLMGLSATTSDVARNLDLLKARAWLDIPIVMNDGSRSILAIEKGSTGQTALNQVLESWGRT